MTPLPLAFRLSGRDILTVNPDVWPSIVGQVGGVLAAMPYHWRWILAARPADLDTLKARLQEERELLLELHKRQRRLATILQLQDLERTRQLRVLEHTLAAWPTTAQEQRTLPQLLDGPLGTAQPLTHWPSFFGGMRYEETRQVLMAEDGSHAWRCLLSGPMTGAVLPTLFQAATAQPFPVLLVVDVQTYGRREGHVALTTAQQQLEAHSYLYQGYDEARQQAFASWQTASHMLATHGVLLHRVQVAVLVQGATAQAALDHGLQVASSLAHVMPLRALDGRQAAIAQFTQPVPARDIPVAQTPHTMITHQVAALVPWGLATDLAEGGLLLGLDEQRSIPVVRDVGKLPALHGVIAGMTGSGKSSYVVTLADRLIDQAGFQAILIDPQRAFPALAAAHPGASYNRISFHPLPGDPPLQLNPLDPVVDDLTTGLVQQVEHVLQLLGWLHGAPLTLPQTMRLRAGLTTLYTSLRGMPLDDPTAIPRLSDLLVTLDRQGPDQTGLRPILEQWTTTTLGAVFDRPTTLQLTMDRRHPVIIYDLSDDSLPQRYRSFFTAVICAALKRVMRRDPRKAIVAIDEAGVLFKDATLEAFAEEFAKTMRRFGCGVWVIDQTLRLLTTQAGQEVFKNSFLTALGLLKTDEAPTLRALFPMLTEHQVNTLLGIGKSEAELERMAGHYTLIYNNQVRQIYNHLSSVEQGLIPRPALTPVDPA